ncbi:hypothetical protein FB480_103453 [Agrobacterium vitis]|nr:hypothetical protein FB480_103453 [Agrobacterium vitis]
MLTALALRRAVVELLTGSTIAGTAVYDTRLDELDPSSDMQPVLAVYTEDDEATPRQKEVYPGEQHLTLVVEAMLLVSTKNTITKPDKTTEEIAIGEFLAADAQTEMLLDVLCYQVRQRVRLGGTDPAQAAFAAVVLSILEVRSYPLRTPDKQSRISQRSIHFRMKVRNDEALIENALLPEPLAAVAAHLTSDSSKSIIAAIAPLISRPATPVRLELIHLTADVDGDTLSGQVNTTT